MHDQGPIRGKKNHQNRLSLRLHMQDLVAWGAEEQTTKELHRHKGHNNQRSTSAHCLHSRNITQRKQVVF